MLMPSKYYIKAGLIWYLDGISMSIHKKSLGVSLDSPKRKHFLTNLLSTIHYFGCKVITFF